ncbi:hypothetical protein GCM10020000_61060 [Streptomyces olivoverticillatus]
MADGGGWGARVRTRDEEFLRAVGAWWDRLLPEVVERQVDRGGPVVLVQVENEYGSYGSDGVYLQALADGLRARGVSVPLVTSDGPEDHMLSGGSVPGGAGDGELRVGGRGRRSRCCGGISRRGR